MDDMYDTTFSSSSSSSSEEEECLFEYVEKLVCAQEECVLCLSTPSNVKLACNHDMFCTTCIEKWKARTCPMCRASITHAQTNDVRFRYVPDEEEVMRRIRWLSERHSTNTTMRQTFIELMTSIASKYNPTRVLQLYHTHAGMVELFVATHSMVELGRIYYAHKTWLEDQCK
jgi:hypothetical protein